MLTRRSMGRFGRLFLVFLLFFAAIAAAVLWYIRADYAWQESYRKTVSESIVSLVQNNPFDKLNVVVVVIDGLRWEEGIGAEGTYIPHIWNDLRPMGTLLTNFWIQSPTATTSVHTAFLTGRVSTVPNDGHIRPVFPTFLESYRDARADYVESELRRILAPPPGMFRPNAASLAEVNALASTARDFGPEKTALYLGKDLIQSLNQSSSGRCPADDVLLVESLRDIEVVEYFRAKVPDVKPNIVFVNLGDVDETGHEGQWHYYVDAIRAADELVWKMWRSLQELSKYRDKTVFIVTTDHGRHEPSRGGFFHHGCFCEGCRRSFMLLVGPGIRQGFVSDRFHSEVDLAPTIGALLGFETPGATGYPISEAFLDPDALPEPRETEVSRLIAEDRRRVEERDNARILLDAVLLKAPAGTWGNNVETAALYLAAASRIRNHPDEAGQWVLRLPSVTEPETMRRPGDMVLGYPFLELSRALQTSEASAGSEFLERADGMFQRARDSALIGYWDIGSSPVMESMAEAALMAAFTAACGRSTNDPRLSRSAYILMLDTLGRLEGAEKVWTPGLLDFINDYRYRQGPNEIFTEREISMRDRMWLLWGCERVLAEADPSHAELLHPLLERQYRLLVAFCHEWQDANAMIGGTGNLGEEVDMAAQGLSLAALADFKPWRRWELDELGYSMNIYATPLFDFPFEDFFYILGQANALAGAWTGFERLKLFVEDDGSFRRNLLDQGPPLTSADPGYPLAASLVIYGLSRFENADYQQFDLELYPIVHQQEPVQAKSE